jgi:sulfur-carrier protein adenylyltransferase/sulfurtransferase
MTPDELARYSRHVMLPEVGIEGQERLKAARVLCVGVGGLGSPAALYLAAAGVGTIGLVDFDAVDVSNLQRQILHSTEDVGRSKLESAQARLAAINPHVRIELHRFALAPDNARALIEAYDVVIDGADNFPTRYLVNDACVITRTPNAYGSIHRFEGQASVFAAPGGPCFRCLHPEPPPPGVIPSCAEAGVLGVLPGVVGTIQATEAIKIVLGIGEPLVGRFLIYDALRMRFRELTLPRDPDCPVCGVAPTIHELSIYDDACAAVGAVGTNPVAPEMTVRELKARIDSGTPPVVVDVREPVEFEICRIPGARLIPLGQLAARSHELPRDAELVLHCKSGARSARAVAILHDRGFPSARNLAGGIIRWIDEIDPHMPRY